MTTPALAPTDLQDMIFFVEVARTLNFTRASKASGIPIATLSRRVAAMEKRVGVRLLARTTRRLALTEPGKCYLERCERILQDAAAAHEVLKEAAERLTGQLGLSMPVEFGLSLVAPVIDEFSRLYPDIIFEADLTPRPASFVDEPPKTDARFSFITGGLNHTFVPESQERTHAYFERVFPGRHHTLHIVPGYGHLDVFIGKRADKDWFPLIIGELDGAA